MAASATVAIPTLNAGPRFAEVLEAVGAQRLDRPIELLVCDSGSRDGTVELARAHGATVIEIPRASFSHGGTRNLLMSRATGDHVALLTQDAVPADEGWLARLLSPFADDRAVGLAFGPYRPVPGASPSVARELTDWFASFTAEPETRVDALTAAQRVAPAASLYGRVAFFTDANGAIARAAWERVPFREVAYAEDHLLAIDMLRAGWAKAYVPGAAVIHSHEYSPWRWLRRSFDEARALREVYEDVPAARPRDAFNNLRGNVGADLRYVGARAPGMSPARRGAVIARSAAHHGIRTAGIVLGAHSARLPSRLRPVLSLERRG